MNVRPEAALLVGGVVVALYCFVLATGTEGPSIRSALSRVRSDDRGDDAGPGQPRNSSGAGSPDADATESDATESDDATVYATGPRWDAGVTVALVAGAVGLLANDTAVFLSAVVGFAYAAYRHGTDAPEADLSVDRTVDERSPIPSQPVEVSLTVRNEGESVLPDLRVVDGVPEGLAVVSGSPRHCTGLRPGESATFSYRVRARRGSHEFGATTLVARNASGSRARRIQREVPTTVTCETRPGEFPLPAETSSYPGYVTTDSGGEGVEFYATREYQSGDPPGRIDWRRFAKSRELTTVEFRETRAATVVLVVDARRAAHVARRDGEPDAVALSEYLAERLAESLLRRDDRVGLAVYGPPESYLAPSGGDEQAARVRATLRETDDALDESAAGLFDDRQRERANERRFDTLRKRLPDAAQVVLLSPMADDFSADVARRFRAYGHAVTVVSPDVAGDTPGGVVDGIERRERLGSVREAGVRVVNWSPDEPIRAAVSEATARWSR